MTTVYIVHMYLASDQLFHNIDLIGIFHTAYFGLTSLTINYSANTIITKSYVRTSNVSW